MEKRKLPNNTYKHTLPHQREFCFIKLKIYKTAGQAEWMCLQNFCKIFLFKFILIEIIRILERGGTCLCRFSRFGIVAVTNKKDFYYFFKKLPEQCENTFEEFVLYFINFISCKNRRQASASSKTIRLQYATGILQCPTQM